ncbi:MAG TPA: hypothetical protein VK421_12740 [Pyrinomonadaceae bacterium]|nr:hypothetical protein [Pyrinomonadaceae bacterium]
MRIIVFILNALIQLAAAAAGFLLLLLGMNGYNERDAAPGLYLYVALGLLSAVALGVASAFAAKWLVERRSFGRAAAAATAVLGSSALGGLILIVSFFAAIALAESMRGTR